MKRQTFLWVAVTVLVVLAFFALASLDTEDVAAQDASPVYSLSPGAIGMIAGPGYVQDGASVQLPEELVTDAVQGYLAQQDNPDLAAARRLEFNAAYQVDVIERDSGRYAFSLMVGKGSGRISPKAGPNVFWNTKYGAELAKIGDGYGMVGHLVNRPAPMEKILSEAEARDVAVTAVGQIDNGLKLDGEARRYYGFYQFDVGKDGALVGEVDVNGYSGQVWYEAWGEPLGAVQHLAGDR